MLECLERSCQHDGHQLDTDHCVVLASRVSREVRCLPWMHVQSWRKIHTSAPDKIPRLGIELDQLMVAYHGLIICPVPWCFQGRQNPSYSFKASFSLQTILPHSSANTTLLLEQTSMFLTPRGLCTCWPFSHPFACLPRIDPPTSLPQRSLPDQVRVLIFFEAPSAFVIVFSLVQLLISVCCLQGTWWFQCLAQCKL